MRSIDITEAFALKLGRIRARARARDLHQAPKDDEPRLRVQDLEDVEREVGIELPDPAIAYVAAGISLWGDGPVMLAKVVNTTMDVREQAVEMGMSEVAARRFVVIDDDSNGNYIAVKKGTPRDSDRVWFLDHEGGFESQTPLSLSTCIDERLEDFENAGSAPPFRFVLVDEPAPPPKAVTVRHPKFGTGKVIADDGDYVTVEFANVGTKRMKRSFVVFE